MNSLESNLGITNKELKTLNEKVEEYNQETEKQMKFQTQDVEMKNEELKKMFLKEISEKESLIKSFYKSEVDTVLGKIDSNCAKLNNQISHINNNITNIKQSSNASDNEMIALKEDFAVMSKSVEVFNNKFEHFQELNNAVINNVKQSLKNTESQISIHERDQKNQLTFLENKLNQKVFTQETMQKFESRFLASELSASNIRNEIENIISKFNGFKVV